MKYVKITIEFKSSAADSEIAEWIEYITGESGGMSFTNPLVDIEANDICDELKAMVRLNIDNRSIK